MLVYLQTNTNSNTSMNITFNLKTPKDPESRIVMVVYLGEKLPLRYSTGLKIPTKFWNNSIQKVRVTKEIPSARRINDTLDDLRRLCEDFHRSNPLPSSSKLKEYLDIQTGKIIIEKETFFSLFEKYIELNSNKKHINAYINTYKALQTFEDAPIEDIGFEYMDRFKNNYLQSKITRYKYQGKNPSISYFGAHIKCIKAVINYYRKRGYKYNPSLNDVKKESTESDSIYLSLDEIKKIEEVPLKGAKEKARDLFIIGCYTAMRVSDYKCLSRENIRDDKIYKTTKKTDERVVIPLHPKVKELLEKYDYQLPSISDVLINRYIKDVAKLAGIEEGIQITRHEGFEKKSYIKKKWELVSSHTARRSGATNMFLAGIPTILIMMITGHKTEKSFLRYVKVTKEQSADILSKHPFFK